MKFVAVRDSLGVVTGHVYYGSVVAKGEDGQDDALKIAVFNDLGRWRAYHPSTFEPYRGA